MNISISIDNLFPGRNIKNSRSKLEIRLSESQSFAKLTSKVKIWTLKSQKFATQKFRIIALVWKSFFILTKYCLETSYSKFKIFVFEKKKMFNLKSQAFLSRKSRFVVDAWILKAIIYFQEAILKTHVQSQNLNFKISKVCVEKLKNFTSLHWCENLFFTLTK